MKIAILGFGAMGSRMAQRLLDHAHDVTVYNRTKGNARGLERAGVTIADSPRLAARGAAVVISVVTDDDASKAMWLDPESGALGGLGPDSVAIESSTLTPRWVRELAATMTAQSKAFLDAPVVGSRPQAEAGQLIHLVGGDAEVLARVEPVLGVIGSAAHHVGAHGSGSVLKLVVNSLFGVQVVAVAELLAMAGRHGVDLEHAVELLGTLPTTSPAARGVMGAILAKRYEPMFPIDLVAKDLGYALSSDPQREPPLPMTAAANGVFEEAARNGLGGENIHAVAKLFATS